MASSSLTIYSAHQIPRRSCLHDGIRGVYYYYYYYMSKSNCNCKMHLANHRLHFRPLCCVHGTGDPNHNVNVNAPDFPTSENDCTGEKNATSRQAPHTSTEMLEKLRRYGLAGLLSYGLLNTAYYLTTFLIVWFYVVPAPGKLGYLPAVKRFLKLLAMVWAGSQVTKLIRAAGALALAPFVEKGLSGFTVKFKFQSEGKAFMAIVGCCFGLAMTLFLVVTLLWA